MKQYEADTVAAEIAELMTEWHLCDPVQAEIMRGRMATCISLIKKFEITKEELSAGINNVNLAMMLASKLTGGN